MVAQCMKCGKIYDTHEAETEIVMGDEAIAIICPIYCPYCGDKGVQVFRHVWDKDVDRIAYKDLDSLTDRYKVSSKVLHGLVAREVSAIKKINAGIPLNLLEQLEVLEQKK